MATIIKTTNEKIKHNQASKKAPLFRKLNYILMIAGAIILILGYFLLRGGAVADPNTFDGEIFNTRRIVVAPILMFLGLASEIVAIMWHPKAKNEHNNTQENE